MRELLEIGKRGLFASNRNIDVAGQNIANANTPGYTRQRAELEPIAYQKNGLSTGLGVNVTTVKQIQDEMVEQRLRQAESDLGGLNEQAQIYKQLETQLVSNTENDLDKLVSRFFNEFSSLSNNPESSALRYNVLNAAQNLTSTFKDLSSGLSKIQTDIGTEASSKLDQINTLLKDVAKLNQQVAEGQVAGQPDNNSIDLRRQRLSELSNLADLNISYNDNNQADVRIGNIVVVRGSNASKLNLETDTINNIIRVRVDSGRTIQSDIGGEFGALADSFGTVVPGFEEKIDTLAENIVTKVNALHRQGYNLKDQTGVNFFNTSYTSASDIEVNIAVAGNPERISASDSQGEPGNSEIAKQIAGLLEAPNAINGSSFIEYTLNTISETGFALNNIETRMASTQSSMSMLEQQRASVSGVNLDEELANIIKFQNAYQASARVISTAQRMYDTLLNMV
jgi:flagellar hook-associated protein 1 FlgK